MSGEAGADIIRALAGDDTIVISNTDWDGIDRGRKLYEDEFGNGPVTSRHLSLDSIDGGTGTDTLEFKYERNNDQDIQGIHFDSSIQGIERVIVSGIETNTYPSLHHLVFDASLWSTLDHVSVHDGEEISVSAYYPRVYIAGDGGSVSIDNLDNETNLKSLSVLGQLSELSLSGFSGTLDEISLGKFGQVASVVGNDSANIFNIEYTRNYDSVSNMLNLSLGDGDDSFNISNFYIRSGIRYSLSGEWEGGLGEDTLYFGNTGSGVLDLTGVSISGFENLSTGSSSVNLLVTENQANSLNITGNGNYLIKLNDGTVQGTSGADNFTGKGVESFKGSAGNDTADFINTAVFSDIRNNYTITRNPDNPGIVTVEHSGGTLFDGTDTLTNTLWLSFADDPVSGPTYSLDDHHQNISANTRELSYGEVFTAVAQYRTDIGYSAVGRRAKLSI